MNIFHKFREDIGGVEFPRRFNNPFYYSPHPLCIKAAEEVRAFLSADESLLAEACKGKMFGVLVVQTPTGETGYIMAFSGLLFGRNIYDGFVPPVYDMQSPQGYFKQEEARISSINRTVKDIEESADFKSAVEALRDIKAEAEKALSKTTMLFKANKEERRKKRESGMLSADDEALLTKQSQFEKAELKRMRRNWDARIEEKAAVVTSFNERIKALGVERRNRSLALQRWLFEQFVVLNANGEGKSLLEIFEEKLSALPPAGAGECAAPKLLQYAYRNSLKPLALAEFWVGESPVGEVRRDGCFYGACKSKCEPILGYMLQGLDVEESALEKGGDISSLEVVYEDESLLVVNKPSGVLSVPGIVGGTSVQQWLREKYSDNTLLVVHRLDMATSGLLVVAKSMPVYKMMQQQFAERKVEKHYMALLDGVPQCDKGRIELPLATDYMNRPRQKVDYENGKHAVTDYSVLDVVIYNGKECALVRFEPLTGRTHQLRMHAASKEGLDCPIVGDALYGRVDKRLMLHAEYLKFRHPLSGEVMELKCKNGFLL
ncbi:MAG: RluA family pseudouridine synthase [Bacteroidaceae bacterium]|nr:RluA family pseudouridine synthase [Bacteroidaceae bacterium]